MALVTYNGIALPYCDITEFSMEAVADPSDTDRILTKFYIGVQTVINADFINSFQAALPAATINNPVAAVQFIYQTLMERRKQLSVTFNSVEMIPERQRGVLGYVDAANGPIPRRCNLIPVDGANNTTFLLLYEIEASYWLNQNLDDQNLNKNLPGNVVLYNRWSESVNIDEANRSTKTRTGKIMIRSDNVKGWIADQVRNLMAVTGLPPGNFIRKSSEYKVDESGLGLEYRITDQEVWRLPLDPAHKAEARYIENSSRAGGKRYGSCSCRLWGDNETSQAVLINKAISFVFGKLLVQGSNIIVGDPRIKVTDRAIVLQTSLDVSAYENVIVFKADVMYGELKTIPRWNLAHLFWDPQIQPIYWSRGTAGLLLQAAKYYDPSLQSTVLGPGTQTDQADNIVVNNYQDIQLTDGRQPGQAGVLP